MSKGFGQTGCKRPPKCVNCKEDHLANSRQCQAWHTEKEILKVKYTRNISFPEARKIVETYTAAPGKSYASITKTAGVTVSCVDAATQTDPVLITAAPQSSSGRPKAALLFWFLGDFRCGALLFMVIHVIYKYKNK